MKIVVDWALFGKVAVGAGAWLMTSITVYYISSNSTDKRGQIKIRNCRKQLRSIRRFKENDKGAMF